MNIIWLPTAIYDLEAIEDYISSNDTASAVRISQIIRSAVERLRVFPYVGRVGRIAQTRELVVSSLPYIIVYQSADADIRIIAILHTAREWPPLL